MEPVSVLHLIPDLAEGGSERTLLDLLSRLDPYCFRVTLVTTVAPARSASGM
jgi:hypothetical protein